ncbi:MAG: ATP-binding cassette domain-containing protein [Candidatus Rokubacteria bacterium]|nr:ATP-binding cassette domain-containing protein [Candidatus Rokubacteria bacterium]
MSSPTSTRPAAGTCAAEAASGAASAAAAPGPGPALLEVRELRQYFPVKSAWGLRSGWVKALDDVSFAVHSGETLGIVGESGCGKSTLAKTLMGIHPPMGGEMRFEGRDVSRLSPRARRAFAPRLQYVYQDPGASLDPRWKIRRSLHEPLVVHTGLSEAAREERVRSILKAVGLPQTHLDLYPHELSGGQQRRVGLARILTLQPTMVILDEPTSGLDVSVQATVLKLFRELKLEFSLTYIFISHDLAVVRMMCNRMAVMYLGRIVEMGDTETVFSDPRHPYTQSLLAAIPEIGGERVTDTFTLQGEPPNPGDLPSGCRFRSRCSLALERCASVDPALRQVAGRQVACEAADCGGPRRPAQDSLDGPRGG